MFNILCYGDSLTWGFDPETMTRLDRHVRWTGVLQQLLGADCHIIEEGLNGRTTVYNDEFTPFKEFGVGSNTLPMILATHAPLDLVVIMLGTNDLQPHRNVTAGLVARGSGKCVEAVLQSLSGREAKALKVLLLAPPALKPAKGLMSTAFSQDVKTSQELAHYYELVANAYHVDWLNTAEYVEVSAVDGVHLDAENNKKLAQVVAEKIKMILR